MSETNLLLADDDRLVRITLASGLRDAGFRVIEAADGEQALAQCLLKAPDIAILDICMPGLTGIEVAHQMAKKAIDIPVIFLSAYSDKEKVRSAVQEGAFGYMVKPIDACKLLPTIETTLQLSEEKILQKMEQNLTEHLIATLTPPTGLVSNNIRWLCRPMSIAGGDMILSAQAPDGKQRLLVGDTTGYGLNAALAGMLAPGIFYGMTSGGRSAVEVIMALNGHMTAQLPANIFMCACMLELSADRRELTVCNRGLPDVLIYNPSQGIRQHIPSNGLPLGIKSGQNFESDTVEIALSANDRIYLCTDGITEMRNEEDDFLGLDGLTKLISKSQSSSFDYIIKELIAYQGDAKQTDDITLLEVTCNSTVPAHNFVESTRYNQHSMWEGC